MYQRTSDIFNLYRACKILRINLGLLYPFAHSYVIGFGSNTFANAFIVLYWQVSKSNATIIAIIAQKICVVRVATYVSSIVYYKSPLVTSHALYFIR